MWINNAINMWVVLVGLPTILYFYIRRQFSFWSKKGVPYVKPNFFFGNIGGFVTKKTPLAHVVLDLYNGLKGERFGGIWEIHSPMLLVVDPELLRDILVKEFDVWPDRGIAANLDVDPLSGHVVSLTGTRWRSVRSKLTPTFTPAKLKRMHYLLVECAKELEKCLDTLAAKDESVEIREIIAKFTTDVIGSCAFGIQMNSLTDENALFRKMGKKIFEPSTRQQIVPVLQFSFPWLFKFLKLSTTAPDVTDFFLKIMKENFDYREKNNLQRHDFVDLLRNLKNTEQLLGEDEVAFDDKVLAAQAFAFFTAGFETGSLTISYCLHELAVNEDVQDRLRAEVHGVKEEDNGEITWNGVKRMKYLDMVVRETLRKYPIVPQVQRIAVKPYRIPGTDVEVPAGIKCMIPIYGLHHDPNYYPDPDKFDPERFTEEASSRRPTFAYLPFGEGPRTCIGFRFAEQQTKMAIVKAVDTFVISLCEKSQNPLRFSSSSRFLYPERGIWLKISRNVPGQNLSS